MSLKVLVVDDEAEWRISIMVSLEDAVTQDIEVAGRYETAIEKIRQTKYDLIILDGLDGNCFLLYQEIRDLPHGNVVILSGDRSLEKQAKEREIPFYDKGRQGLTKLIATYRPTE